MTNFFKTIGENWSQLLYLARADLKKTYRGAALGWVWAVIKPTILIFVYWFAIALGLRSGNDYGGMPFFLWLIAGVVPWFSMSEMILQGMDSITKYRYLVTKIKFPTYLIPIFICLSKLFVHLVMLGVVIVLFWCFGYPPTVYYLQLPLYVLMTFLFFAAWSIFASPLSAISKDFSSLVRSLVTALFWMSGIIWDPRHIENPWIRKILIANPINYLVNGYRNVFIYRQWVWKDELQLAVFLLCLVIMAVLAWVIYHRFKRDIHDIL